MRALLLAAALLTATLVVPAASAWPPVCIEKHVGEEGDKVSAEVWVTCHARVVVTTCPKDGFCSTWSSDDLLP